LDSERLFITFGTLILLVICAVPIANAAALLDDFNFVFWAGRTLPTWLMTFCGMAVVLWILTGVLFFKYSRPSSRSEQSIVMIAHTFITMLGLIFMMVSLSLVSTANDTYDNLHRRCQFSDETHKVFEFSQVLHALRSQPGCKDKFSVENCDGYQDAPPYTTFLKSLEDEFRCSGFCYLPPGQPVDTSPALLSLSVLSHKRSRARNTPAARSQQDMILSAGTGATASQQKGTASNATSQNEKELIVDGGSSNATSQNEKELIVDGGGNLLNTTAGKKQSSLKKASNLDYPPALFSDSQFQVSCDGTAARDMRDFAGDIGHQLWYQGLYLVSISIGTGFLKLVGFCVSFQLFSGLKVRRAYAKEVDM